MVVPQFRGYFSVAEKREWRSSFTFMNAIMGWHLGGGWEFNREWGATAGTSTRCALDSTKIRPTKWFTFYSSTSLGTVNSKPKINSKVNSKTNSKVNSKTYSKVNS